METNKQKFAILGNKLLRHIAQTIHTMCYGFHIIIHPFEGFWELKYSKKNTFAAANLILVLVCVIKVFDLQFSGFIFAVPPENINIMNTFLSMIVPIAAWTILNWALSTLFDGKATMKQIWVQTCYSYFPTLLLTIPAVLLSHVLVVDESALITILYSIMNYWFFLLLIAGNLTIQDYTLSKTIIMGIFTILGIAAAAFIGMLIFSTFQQLLSFISTISLEFRYMG